MAVQAQRSAVDGPRGPSDQVASNAVGVARDAGANPGGLLAAFGGILGALVASSCCVLPVALFSLGISGAWIGNFTQLAPYKPYILAATVGFLATGYGLVWRTARRECADDRGACARAGSRRFVKVVLIAATVLTVSAWGFDHVAPYLLS